MVYRIVALGDSVTTGVGDTVSQGLEPGWVGHLARRIDDSEVIVCARMGARAKDVLREQVPGAMGMAPDLVTILIGGNDVLRKGFHPGVVADTVSEVLGSFGPQVRIVLVLLHDPRRVLPEFSGDAGRVISRRAAALNDHLRRMAAGDSRVTVVDISTAPGAHDLRNWHVDRMHPSPTGHRWLARLVATALGAEGLVATVEREDPVPPARARWIQLVWFVAAGIPWALKRSVDLLPELVAVILSERKAKGPHVAGLREHSKGPHVAGLSTGDPDRARTGDLRRDRAAR